MKNLLKLSYFRILRSKVLIVMFALALVALLFLPLVELFVFGMTKFSVPSSEDYYFTPIFGTDTAHQMFAFGSFSYMSVSAGTIGPIPFMLLGLGIVIFMNSENRSGAIRNQITAGNSRTKVYYSYYLSVMSVPLATIVVSTVLIFFTTLIKHGLTDPNPPSGAIIASVLQPMTNLQFYATYLIVFVAFFSLLTAVFAISARFNNMTLAIMFCVAIVPMTFTMSSIITSGMHSVARMEAQEKCYELGESSSWFGLLCDTGNAMMQDFRNLISWNPFHIIDTLVSAPSPFYIEQFGRAGGVDFSSIVNALLGISGMHVINWFVLLRGFIYYGGFYAIFLCGGEALYRRREFK